MARRVALTMKDWLAGVFTGVLFGWLLWTTTGKVTRQAVMGMVRRGVSRVKEAYIRRMERWA